MTRRRASTRKRKTVKRRRKVVLGRRRKSMFGRARRRTARIGLIIGRTVSGKPVYSRKAPRAYRNFTAEDHADASWEHGHAAQSVGSVEGRTHHTKLRNEHVNAVVSAKYNEEK